MRMWNLIKGDIGFQIKYGFYFIYAVFTLFYILLLLVIPPVAREKAAAILIFTDPAAMGLFFMGAIVLLEKSQNILNSIAVSPVSVSEYIISKAVSLGLISTLVGIIIAVAAGIEHLFLAGIGIFLGSVLFSLIGLTIATKISSLNMFIVATLPIEILCFLPPLIYLFRSDYKFLLFHPGCIILRLITGEGGFEPLLLLVLIGWVVLIYLITHCVVKKMFLSVGGVKL